MLDSYYRLEVPSDLAAYYHVTDVFSNAVVTKKVNRFQDLFVERNSLGNLVLVKYYAPDGELAKEVCYKDSEVYKIRNFLSGFLYSTEEYKNGVAVSKDIYTRNGNLAYRYEYEHNVKGEITSICKKSQEREVLVVYKNDDFGRIIKRKLFLNNEKILEQHFGYDILDRITAYTDDNQRIVVNKFGKKNELLSYVITDKMNNSVKIENVFIGEEYHNSRVTVNGHSSTIINLGYVDNVMLKKPYASEDDLDLIIANLFGEAVVIPTDDDVSEEKKLQRYINSNIEQRVLPISIRKRLLYNKVVSRIS